MPGPLTRTPVRRPPRLGTSALNPGQVKAHAAWRAGRLRRSPILGRLAWIAAVATAFAIAFVVQSSEGSAAAAPATALETVGLGTVPAPPGMSKVAGLPAPPAPERRRVARRPAAPAPATTAPVEPAAAATPAPTVAAAPAPPPPAPPAPAPVITSPSTPDISPSPPRPTFDSKG